MRQEVNLLNRPPEVLTPVVSFNTLFGLCCACACLLIIVSIYQENTLSIIKQDITEIERENVFQQQTVVKSEDIVQYQNKLSGLEKQLLRKYQLWAKYKAITNAGKDGFSQYFYHIANLANKNLSLYEISVSERGNHLALKGYAIKAEDIPIYINDLKYKKELKNVTFGDLSIENIKDHQVLRFILAKKQDKDSKGSQPAGKKINISDIMKMSLASHNQNIMEVDQKNIQPNSLSPRGGG